jgi:hypothetical protein
MYRNILNYFLFLGLNLFARLHHKKSIEIKEKSQAKENDESFRNV